MDVVIGRFNDVMHESNATRQWVSLKGKKFNARFIYVLAWKYWVDEIIARRDRDAAVAWESVFDEDLRARRAIESKVNLNMSLTAKKQAEIWMKTHRLETETVERLMASEFAEDFGENAGSMALIMSEDSTGKYPPTERAKCMCWTRLNPVAYGKAKDERSLMMAEMFAEEFSRTPSKLVLKS